MVEKTLKLDETLWLRLDTLGRRTGKSFDEIANEALARYLIWRETFEEDPMERLIGSIASGETETSEQVDKILYG